MLKSLSHPVMRNQHANARHHFGKVTLPAVLYLPCWCRNHTTLSATSVSCATPTTGAEIAPMPTSAIASQLAQKNEDHPGHTHSTQRLKRLLSCSEYSKVKFSPILKMGAPRIRTQEQSIRCAAEDARINEPLCAFLAALLPPETPANRT